MNFKDLGLLIIDEEHRFGVSHKESLRRIRRSVDTLALTATPIPRTLQMSLSGVRDMSVIDTPPEDRYPIATFVGEFDREMMRSAIKREIAREGQVFYVYNRVQDIEEVARDLRKLFPDKEIAVAHGQMNESELENTMLEFAQGIYNVLVCTTIIESGLDLPHVNTLIVDGADRMGLAQLYQLRGRVGRAHQRAFAYLFFRDKSLLTDSAAARLSTIAEMTALGSGTGVAMRDLEIRGAGNLLGHEQHGYIEAVGFELYCMLLEEAVESLSGEKREKVEKAQLELPLTVYLPPDYVSEEEMRIDIYRRVMTATEENGLDELSVELDDRFGPLPEPAELLMEMERIRVRGGKGGLKRIHMTKDEVGLRAGPKLNPLVLESLGRARPGDNEIRRYFDKDNKTLYVKLKLKEFKNRQVELLMWLNSIIDDIISTKLSILTRANEGT